MSIRVAYELPFQTPRARDNMVINKEKKRELQIFRSILSKSKLTKKDAKEIGDKIKTEIAKRHGS